MATTITKLFPTGVLQSAVEFDEISYTSVKVSPTGVYAREFDEVSLAPSILSGLTSGGAGQQDRGQGIAIDSQGNTYIVAYGGGGGSETIMYLIKYDSASNILWQKSLSGVAPMTKGLKVTTDSSNNVYVVGLDELSASPYTKWLVVVKFDPSGSIQWQRRLETNNNTVNSSIALDSSNNVYIGSSNYSSKSSYLIVKYDSSGVIQWQRTLSNSGSVDMYCNGIVVDSSGNVYGCGTFGNSPTLSVIVKFNTSGVYQWHYTLGDNFPSSVWLYGMSIDSSNNIFMTGVYYNPASGQSILLTKINSSGALQWQRTLAQANNSQGYATAVDTAGNVYVTGKTNNVWDIIIAKYNTSGTLQWQRTLSSSGYELGYNMSISSSGNIHLTGSTTVGGTEDIYFSKLPSDGSLTGSVIVGGYGFTYSPSSLTTATSTISYNLNTPGYTVSASSSGLPESAGVLTVTDSTLTSTNNGGGATIPAERRTSTGTYMVSGYFDEYSMTVGQQEFTTPGTYSWTAPEGVTNVSVVAVGGGGGGSIGGFSGTGYATSGGGGGLGWKNNITVVQGQTYTVVVGVAGDRGVNPSNQPGSDGGDSYFISAGTVLGGKGFANGTGGTYIGDGGGNGGLGRGGGGGAGGYSGNGGNGETYWNFPTSSNDASDGSGGGGGGGTCSAGLDPSSNGQAGGGGGGVGIRGQGASGLKGQPAGQVHSSSPGGDVQPWRGGGGGSGGTNAIGTSNSGSTKSGNAGQYGGGGGGWGTGYSSNTLGGKGGSGAVRIIWGAGRAFPSTNTNDV